jgi:hypothetical protein
MTFRTPAEAKAARPNLDLAATMRAEEYGGLIEHNDFPEMQWVTCQLINRFGNVCRKLHGFGYVVRRKDAVELFVGGDCFKSHLAEAGESLAKQFDSDIAELKRKTELADAQRRLAEKKADVAFAAHVAEVWRRASQLKELQDIERRALGPRVLERLSKMAKAGTRFVPGETKHVEMREDKNQQPYAVEVWKPTSFGALAGLGALNPGPLERVIAELRTASTVLKSSTVLDGLEYRQLKKLLKTFEPIESIPQRLDAIEQELASFTTAANWRSVSWLARDEVDRERIIRHALEASGQPRSSSHIRALVAQWLAEIQRENRGRECRPL